MAFILSLLLFFYYFIVGLSATRIFNIPVKRSVAVLLSPAIGLSFILLPIFYINRLGIPVKEFAFWVFLALLVLSIIVLYIKKTVICIARLGRLILLWIVVLVFASWPLIWFGFDWLGVANDDMANYCLGAQRFYNEGFFDPPNIDQIKQGKNYSQAYWFMHVVGGARPGSELLLSWVWGVTGIEAPRIFMPTISSLHMVLASSTAALATSVSRSKKVWIYSLLLFAVNPLSIWGVGQQLIGQVGGFALVVAAVTVIYQKIQLNKNTYRVAYNLVPTVFLLAALMIWYPEGLPFIVGGWVLMILVKMFFGQSIRAYLWPLLLTGLVFLIMPIYFTSAIKFLLMQSASVGAAAAGDPTALLFPYYLIPSGVIAFWGIIPVHQGSPSEPFATLLFLISLILVIIFFRCIIFGIFNSTPSAMVLIIMLILAARLYYLSNDFGLYKLAMYAQPFLVALMTPIFLDSKIKYGSKLKFLLLIVGISQINTAFAYGYRSTGEAPGSSVEIQNGSSRRVLTELKDFFDVTLMSEKYTDRPIISNTDNVVLAKLIAFYGAQYQIVYPSRDFFGGIVSYSNNPIFYVGWTKENEIAESKNYIGKEAKFGDQNVVFFEPTGLSKSYRNPNPLFLSTCKTSVISEACDNFIKLSDSYTGAIFVHSDIGAHYYSGNRKNASFFQNETDIYPPGMFASLGRYMLLQFPSLAVDDYFAIDISATLQKTRGSTLPTVIIRGGGKEEAIHFVGRGSGRLYSRSVPSSEIDGIRYALLDMNVVPETFPNRRTLISYLYGRDVLIDMRRITVFGRGLHTSSRQAYDEMTSPSGLREFPLDLKNPALEYSGIYEDGWISEQSFFVLSPKSTSQFISVTGVVPQIEDASFSTVLKLSVNGQDIAAKTLGIGNFDLRVPVKSLVLKQRIELSFTNYQKLPGGDGRITPAKINFIGFE